MPQTKAWNAKRERQDEQDQRSLQQERARPAELSGDADSPRREPGLRELLKLASERGVKGRSTMNKAELEQALKR